MQTQTATLMNRLLAALQRPMTVHVMVLFMMSIYWLVRMFAFSGLSADEAEQVLFAQSFQWGYDVANPPLYTWILIALFKIFGKSAAVVLLFKFALLYAIYASLFQAARLILGEERRLDAALVGLSPVLFFFVSWHSIFNYSHSLLNALFVIVTFIAFEKVAATRQARWYALFGLAIGIGLLSKYAFALFVLALVVATISTKSLRMTLISPKIVLTALIAMAVVAPHAVWMLESRDLVDHAIAYKLQTQTDAAYLETVGKGLWNLVRATFAFMSPMWLIGLLVFPTALKSNQDRPQAAMLLDRTFLAILALMIGMVIIGGISQFRPNYLFILVLFPLWLFARLPGEQTPGKRRRIYATVVVGAMCLSVLALGAKAISDPLRCKKCLYLTPYEDIAQALIEDGFIGGSMFATWYPSPLPGNLALHLPDARIVSHKFTHIKPPSRAQDGQCMAVWVPRERGGKDVEAAAGSTNGAFGTNLLPDHPFKRLELPLYRAPDKSALIEYFIIDPASGIDQADCR